MSLFVADFCSGLDGWGAAFRDRGHRVVSFDLDPRFKPNVVVDMNNVKAVNGFDVILASPPCECFSVMTIGKNWRKEPLAYEPKRPETEVALALMRHTFALIDAAKPRYHVIENPRGMMRKLAPRMPNTTVWYCRLGFAYAKPTDLWTNLTGFAGLTCRSGGTDHEYAPRGSRTGVQGIDGTEYPGIDFARMVGGGDDGFAIVERPFVSTGGNAALVGKEIVEATRLSNGRWDTRSIRKHLATGKRVVGWRVDQKGSLRHRTRFELTGGTRKAARALIPYRLSLAVCLAAERDGTLPSMEEVIEVEAKLRRVA